MICSNSNYVNGRLIGWDHFPSILLPTFSVSTMLSPVTTTIQAALGVTTTTSQAPGVMMAPVIQTASNIASRFFKFII
jgi:hypothetical protein